MQQWQIQQSAGRCVKTGRALGEGERYYAVLFEDGESFRREAYCMEAWEGPPDGAYCSFKTRVPQKEKKKRLLVDDDVLINFFTRLADETQPVRLQFRFVLALILMRKRILKYEETLLDGGLEFWLMRLSKQSEVYRVLNPRLSDDEIENVSQELGAILHGDVADVVDTEIQDGRSDEGT